MTTKSRSPGSRDTQSNATGTTNAAIIEVISGDPELQARVRQLVNKAISHAEWVLKFGAESDRLALMRSVVPAMMRALQNVDAANQDAEQREAYGRLMENFKGHHGG